MRRPLAGGLLTGLTLILSWCTTSTSAIYASQAGSIDWHSQYVGIPHTSVPALESRFHRVGRTTSTAKAIYLSATKKNVLAALNPSEGNIVWRRKFEDDDPIVAFKPNQDGIVSLSGNGGATVRLFEVINGNLIWESHLHDSSAGYLASTPAMTGTAIEFDMVDVFILSNGHTIRRLVGTTGETKWGYTTPDMGSSTILTKLIRTRDGLFALGLTTNLKGFSLTVLSLNPDTGELWERQDVASATLTSPDDFFVLKQGTVGEDGRERLAITAGIVWLQDGSVKECFLSPGLETKFLGRINANKYGPYSSIRSVGVEEKGFFLGVLQEKDGKEAGAHIYRMEVNAMGLVRMGEFAPALHHTHTLYAGGIDRQGQSYLGKLSYSARTKQASYEVFAPAGAQGRGMSTGFTFEYDPTLVGAIDFAAIDVVNTAEYQYVSRLILSTSTGTTQQYAQETMVWTREESLTDIRAIVAVDLPELSTDASAVYRNMHETTTERLVRQAKQMKSLPLFLFHFARRFATGKYASPNSPMADAVNKPQNGIGQGSLWRDTYGLKKVLVVATGTGKVFGIETLKGQIVWNIKLGGGSADFRMKIDPIRMTVLKTVSEGFHPEVGLVVQVEQSTASGEASVTTGITRLDATTGASQSIIMYRGEVHDAFEVDVPTSFQSVQNGLGKKVIGIVDKDHKMHIYPYHEAAIMAFNNVTTRGSFLLQGGPPTQRTLEGLALSPRTFAASSSTEGEVEHSPIWDSYQTWRSSFAPGENVISVVRSATATTGIAPASHGRVLGDRSTLYKYANPHLVAVLTESHAREGQSVVGTPHTRCTVYLLDSVKGATLYSAVVPAGRDSLIGAKASGSASACDVKISLVENWLVYHYYDDDAAGTGARGWRVASVELYEGGPNVKTKSGELPAGSANRAEVTPLEQVFIFPSDVKAMITTSTKYGISSKDIVVINGKGQVQTFPRRFLDPRRPKNAPTAQEKEEGLIKYDAILPDDPRRVVSHGYPVFADTLLTTSTQLESTSLVLAYGLDLFMTRVSPSGSFDVLSEEFNKIQLILTVLGLGAGIMITRPLVKAKIRKARWYS